MVLQTMTDGGKKAKKERKPRKLTAYNKFVRECSKSKEGKTRSGADMIKYCAKEWKKLSDAQKAAYK